MDAQQRRFQELIHQHQGIIRKVVALYARHPSEWEDLQQEILFQAWRSFASFAERSKFSTWLYRVSLNTVLTHRRRRRLPVDSVGELPEQVPESSGNEQLDLLHQAIRQLPEAERAIILLHLDGYENAAIAELVGISKNYVAVKLHRIRQELIHQLQPRPHGSEKTLG